jgi:rhodanese-related sulfurtransferase
MKSSLKALSVEEVVQLRDSGAQLVDVREAADFEGAYLAGSINIGLKGKYATWAGSILSHDAPIIVIGDGDNEEEAVMRLGRIGFDNAVGYLKDGMEALNDHPDLIRKVSRITALALAEQESSEGKPFVLDVRSEKEFGIVHLADGYNIPLTHVRERIAEVPMDRPVVVHCEGGYRSAIACSLLTQAGRTNVSDMVGGIKAWIATKLPTVPEATMTCGTKICETVPA